MSSLFHVDYNIIISNQFIGLLYLIQALKATRAMQSMAVMGP
jgi:hypothetical protein